MAIPKIKATYSLDAETVGALERVARRWGVSKSEAIRRAIHASEASAEASAARDTAADAPPINRRLAAFRRAQQLLQLDAATADAWIADIRAERQASSERIERRWDEAETVRRTEG
jgi:hypothetical protein